MRDIEREKKLKDLLYSYTYLEDEIEGVNEEICNLYEVQKDISIPCLPSTPGGSGIADTVYYSVEKIMITYAQEMDKLNSRLDKLLRKRNVIRVLLDCLEHNEQRIIELRYFKKYKIWMISSSMHYDRSHIYRLHDGAIEKMLGFFNKNNEWF